MKTARPILALMLVPALALPARAQEADPDIARTDPGAALFDEADADGDGAVTREELQALRAARAAALDTDGNGTLSAAELVAFMSAEEQRRIERRVAAMMERFDADGDGELGAAELAAGHGMGMGMAGQMFDRADADGDGTVTRAEFEAFAAERAEHRGGRGGAGGRHGGRGMP